MTPVTPVYDPLESDSEVSETNKRTIEINNCDNCDQEKCLKCELKGTDFETANAETNLDSLEPSPVHSATYTLNRLSAVSTSSNEHCDKKPDSDVNKTMTSSHESSSSYSTSLKQDELYECFNFKRPNYINLQSSSTSKSSPGSPLKSPLKSTISITFRSPTKVKDFDQTPTERDSVYEDVDLDKNLSIVEEASIPDTDASLPTQQACQPDSFNGDLIILETPIETHFEDADVYSQVKFFKKSIEEVNALIFDSPETERHYENVTFEVHNDYENINVDIGMCDKRLVITEVDNASDEHAPTELENGNVPKTKNVNVKELAIRFESPTEQKTVFTFDKFKAEIKYSSLERKNNECVEVRNKTPSPKPCNLTRSSSNARSLDESAFVKEFANDKYVDRRKSFEVRDVERNSKLRDLNLNLEENGRESTTPTTENKISLIQRFNEKRPTDIKHLISQETEKKLSRERIEKYKEERRNFLREKYSSQSFRSNPEQLTRIKIKKDQEEKECERLKDLPKFERRNTVDLGQRMRFSLARSSNNLDTIPSPTCPERNDEQGESSKDGAGRRREFDR